MSRSEDIISTLGLFSTSEGYHEYIGRYHEYIGGYHEYIGRCSVHRKDTMMHVGGYHEYIVGCSVYQRETMLHVGGYHDSCGGYHGTLGDVQYIGFSI